MNVFHGMGLEGVGPFKKQAFSFEPGITAVYGLNRAGGKNSNNANGAGKSYFFSSLKEMIFDEPVVGEKDDRTKQGKRVFEFTTTAGKRVRVERQARGRSDHLAITVDGKEMKHLTSTKARAYLKKVFPITEEEYDTYVHIDARIPHPLVMGNSTARKKFFTDFFQLDKIDAERKLYANALKELNKVKAAYSELLTAYKAARRNLLDEEQVGKLETSIKKKKALLKQLTTEANEVSGIKQLMQFARDAKEQIVQLTEALGEIDEEAFAEARKANAWELDKVRKDLEDAELWERYQVELAHYDKAFARLSNEAKRLLKQHGQREAVKLTSEAAGMVIRHKGELKRCKGYVEEVEAELKDGPPEEVAKPDGEEGELETLQRAYSHQLEHAEQFNEGKCETCGQVVKIKDPKVLKKKLDSVTARLRAFEDYREYRKAAKQYSDLRFKLKAYKRDVERVAQKLNKELPMARLYEELKELPRRPKPFEGKKLQTKVLQRMMDELKERKQLLHFFSPHIDTLVAYRKLTAEQKAKVKDSGDLHERIDSLQDQISKQQAQIEVHRTVEGQVQSMRKRLVAMKKELADEEPLKLLVQGFSDKHMKKMAIEAISAQLMKVVNKYAKIVFAEDYFFDFIWDTKLQMRVHRRYGKRVDVSDVRKLSGAESKLFTLILVLALLTFVPEHKRSSLLILDEPTANFSEETTRAFQELLPVLNKLIPSIIVITPKPDVYEGAKVYTVEKKAGVSQIVPGFPHALKKAA